LKEEEVVELLAEASAAQHAAGSLPTRAVPPLTLPALAQQEETIPIDPMAFSVAVEVEARMGMSL